MLLGVQHQGQEMVRLGLSRAPIKIPFVTLRASTRDLLPLEVLQTPDNLREIQFSSRGSRRVVGIMNAVESLARTEPWGFCSDRGWSPLSYY